MGKIVIRFTPDWIDANKDKGAPVRRLEHYVSLDEVATLLRSTRESLTIEIESDNRIGFLDGLNQYLLANFMEEDVNSVYYLEGDIEGLPEYYVRLASSIKAEQQKKDSKKEEPKKEEPKKEEPKKEAPKKEEPKKEEPKKEEPKKEAPKKEEPKKVASSEDSVDEEEDPMVVFASLLNEVPMKHSPALQNYLREINSIIPMMQQMDNMPSFWAQNLLVSMDAGYGLSSFMRAVAKVMKLNNALDGDNLAKMSREIVVHRSVDDKGSPTLKGWDPAMDLAESLKSSNEREHRCGVLCLDISAWIDQLHRNDVKNILKELNDLSKSYIIIFRIPFMEAHVVADVEECLSDVLNVTTLSTAPLSIPEMVDYMKDKLTTKRFTFDDSCIDLFEDMIIQEKNDDSFFGYKSLSKIVNKIIYDKALCNCSLEKSDMHISPADIRFTSGSTTNDSDPLEVLNNMIGIDSVKQQIQEIIVSIKTQQRLHSQGKNVERPCIHMMFKGNPGTGKTTVARLVAQIMKNEGILRKGRLHEVKGRDLCGQYVGQTAPLTSAHCRDAYGSVLFIDEAYSLFHSGGSKNDYGKEALDTLVAEMENHRDDMCIIMAGYGDEMEDMLNGNVGLRSRIPYRITFPNYTKEELERIFFYMLGDNFEYDDGFKEAIHTYFKDLPEQLLESKEFSNARFVRNLYEKIWGKAAYRCSLTGDPIPKLQAFDLESVSNEDDFKALTAKKTTRPIGFGN